MRDRNLHKDIARCRGVGSDEDGWREGCEKCLRRLSDGGYVNMKPPEVIMLECEYLIEEVSRRQDKKSK